MKKIQGAGGTKGGIKGFFIGLAMMAVGFYILLSKIILTSNFGMGYRLYHHAGVFGTGSNLSVTTGMILIPLIIGICMIFYNAKSIWGWIIAALSLFAMIFGVISSLKISLQPMNAFDFIFISVLAFGGLGMLLKSLRNIDLNSEQE
jgi:hypothetical protein